MITEKVLQYFSDSHREVFLWPAIYASDDHAGPVEYHLEFQNRSLGNLHLPTGRVVASDPLVFYDQPPFVVNVSPGTYEVNLSVATLIGYDRLVAFAMLKFGDVGRIVQWELLKGEPWPNGPGGPTLHYSVDSGTGCFMDLSTQHLLSERLQDPAFDERFCQELQGPYEAERIFCLNHTLPNSDGNNVVAFSSGWGDGGYSTFAGLDSDGDPMCFVTDFAVIRS